MERSAEMRVLVIGQAPARSDPRGEPLSERTLSGRKLRELGLEWDEAVNLSGRYPGREPGSKKGDVFKPAASRLRLARRKMREAGVVVLLGRKVAAAMGYGELEFLQARRGPLGSMVVSLPHPSGVCMWWNYPENVAAARRLAAAIREGQLGEVLR